MNRLLATASLLLTATAWLVWAAPPDRKANDPATAPNSWTTTAPRDEIRPAFAHEPAGGVDGRGALVITADRREGLDGWWTKTLSVQGGKHYRFQAFYQARNVAVPRRSVVVKLHWQDEKGKKVPLDEPAVTGYLRGATPMADSASGRSG